MHRSLENRRNAVALAGGEQTLNLRLSPSRIERNMGEKNPAGMARVF